MLIMVENTNAKVPLQFFTLLFFIPQLQKVGREKNYFSMNLTTQMNGNLFMLLG